MMNRGNLSRRGFLAKSVAGAVAVGLPVWFAKDLVIDAQETKTGRQPAANDRIVMGAIGTGTNRLRRGNRALHGERGVHIMQNAMAEPGVQFIAVCDVDRPNGEFAQNLVRTAQRGGSRDCALIPDYRRLLENRNINAVTIGTPDHWHAQIAIAAMQAGKDVYCEKPMTLTVEESILVSRVARETRKVFQVGTQQRTEYGGRFRLAAELVRNGRIGRVRRITTLIGTNPAGGPFQVRPVPEGLDWNFWLGPTPQVPFVTERCHYEFRWWYDYSGGKMTDWGAHHNDIAQWALGMDESGPISVRGTGAAPSAQANSYNCHPTFEVTYTYGNGPNGGAGTQLVCRSGPAANWPIRENNNVADNGILFEGDDNKWIWVSRRTIQASEPALLDEALPPTATRLPRVNATGNHHMRNFLDCVRSRERPICHANVGHRSVTVCHIGVIATRFFANQTLPWSPVAQQFTGDNAEAANRHLSRARRPAWRLEA
ncbi:MAG: Gfo/Idh/MocA family oxidoreductase [Planctomycetes bacterium]|nr:Gfo/Idh/MocA family oxidoreductase [Planctomycetota bacterium]